MTNSDTKTQAISLARVISVLAGPLLFAILLLTPTPEAFTPEAWRLVAVAAWMIVWWMTEAAPVPVTALLPIPLFPIVDIANQKAVASSYGHPLIFLFLGGFIIAAAMQRWGLHKRIALFVVSLTSNSGASIIGGFMVATAFLSMWISNTATTLMMFTVGISLIEFIGEKIKDEKQVRRFGIALMLGIAYSASIGGVATLIGTPPNTLLASFLTDTYDIHIDFATWMILGVPIVIIMLPIAWVLLCKVLFPVGQLDMGDAGDMVKKELAEMGPMSRGERTVMIIFGATVVLWITRKWLVAATGLSITDTTIALVAASLLFVIPVSLQKGEWTVEWTATKNVPWGVLILFGGGLALAAAFKSTGLAAAIGTLVGELGHLDIALIILVTIVSIVFLTEITSNIATTATFLPILAAVSLGLGFDAMVLAIPVALAASMAFMMPVATPPNAIVFSYEGMSIQDMVKAGIWLNIIAIGVIYLAVMTLAPAVFDLAL